MRTACAMVRSGKEILRDITTRNKSKIFAKFPLQYSSHLIKYVTFSEAFILIIAIS